jgi:hypothetical protein
LFPFLELSARTGNRYSRACGTEDVIVLRLNGLERIYANTAISCLLTV